MELFHGSAALFMQEAEQARIAQILGDAYYDYFRFRASASEFNSWNNSLKALALQLRYSGCSDDHGVVLEMRLPLSSARLDAMIFGRDDTGAERAVLIELKQWSEAMPSEWDGCVEAFVGKAVRKVLHPCVQARSYTDYLESMHTSFYPQGAGAIALSPCAYLHNMHPAAAGVLRSTEFTDLLKTTPLFVGSDVDSLKDFISAKVGAADGISVMEKALTGKHAPSLKLLEHTAAMVAGEPRYKLIDDQVIAYNAVLGMVRRAQKDRRSKAVVAVHGGPGTGKSVIALNLLGTLSKLGVNVQHATGSKTFTGNLWRILGNKSKAQIRYFNNFGEAEAASVDVILADEAHRIRESSNSRYTPAAKRSTRSQIDEIVDAAKVSVFFIDDYQTVRPGEIGSSQLIREAAVRHDARYESVDLRTQFRCAGSDEYIDWVDQLLEIRKTGVSKLNQAAFECRLINDPFELEEAILRRSQEGYSARITAGFCWPWSEANDDGTLALDVQIGEFRRPWNARPEARRLSKDIPPATFWPSDPKGVRQIGCVYTAQGFEFDYAGVIWGEDLVIRNGVWVGQPSVSRDTVVKRSGARFTDVVKNTYRVLLTRGMRGVYLHVVDSETREYISNRLSQST